MYELVLNVHTNGHRGTTCPYVLLGSHIHIFKLLSVGLVYSVFNNTTIISPFMYS